MIRAYFGYISCRLNILFSDGNREILIDILLREVYHFNRHESITSWRLYLSKLSKFSTRRK